MGLLEPHGGMRPLGCHLLGQDIFDVVGAKGLREGRPLHGVEQGLGALVILESQELLDLLFQGLIGGGQVLERPLGSFASGNQGGHCRGVPGAAVMFVRGLTVRGEFNTLFALPAPSVGSHGLVLAGTHDLVMIGLDGNGVANQPRRDGLGMTIKADGTLSMPLDLGRIATIR
jgi:hypothetical protein